MRNSVAIALSLISLILPDLGNAQGIERQPLHLCAPPSEPIENDSLLKSYDLTVKAEYYRYFDELNAYLLCLQRSQADIIEKANVWTKRFQERFPDD